MKKVLTSALILCLGASVGLAQYVDPPAADPPELTLSAVDVDDGELTWNYVGPRATANADDTLYLETTSSGFFSPHGQNGPRSFADDVHNNLPMSINRFQYAWVSRTSAGNVPLTHTVSFVGNDCCANVVGPTWGSVTITGLQTGAFVTSVTVPSKIATGKDIYMRVQFDTNTGGDTGQLIGADLNNPEGGNPGGSHDWYLVYDDPSDTPLGLGFFGGYTPNLPTSDPNYTLPGNYRLGIFGKEIEPVEITVEIKGGDGCSPLNPGSHGVLPVRAIGVSSLPGAIMTRADGDGGSVASNEGPPGPSTNSSGGDSQIKFNTDEVVAELNLGSLAEGDTVELCVTGFIDALNSWTGCDCVTIVPPGNSGPTALAVKSNLPGQWIAMSPADDQADTGGYGTFNRTYPVSTHVVLEAEENYQGKRFVGWTFNDEFLSRYLITAVDVNGSNANGKKIDAVFRRAGDITGDDAVNLTDFALFAVCYGQSWGSNGAGCSNESLASSDLNRDGIVNLADFAIFAVNFGT